jgi:uncharacterized membrane protein YphA (DoxX/SURF4 family)
MNSPVPSPTNQQLKPSAPVGVSGATDAGRSVSNLPSPTKTTSPTRPPIDSFLEWAFRLGLSSVFIINSITALKQPDSFLSLIKHNFVAVHIGHYQVLLDVIAVNDMTLGILLLIGFKKKYVYAWAGVWLAIVSFFKLTALT